MTLPGPLTVRRSVHIPASPQRVWKEFAGFEPMKRWWGVIVGTATAGKPNGQRLVEYEPRLGGRVEMEVVLDGKPLRYGGPIVVFRPLRQLTIKNDWIPNAGWQKPTFITLRLSPALNGTLVELLHFGFEKTGPAGAQEHEVYETGWGMTQLSMLNKIVREG
jgi:uncharacterized protein YndB with AHSA1/START domain